ncbi:MAG TPA: serine/threonine-protein kinase [Planctomycetota bacterium]|nr:serine/threonine-protein kinase [Planctomycetota bacterium]
MPTIHSNQSSGSGIHIKLPRIAGFTLLEPLHEGSCGLIYRARQDRLGRIVALKLLPEWPPATDVALERFNRSAYVNAQAPHANLITLYDTGTRDGFHYVSLEYVNGQTLQKHLSQIGTSDERFALHVAVQVLRALSALHARDICHRNVKPKNIFVETNGNIRLIGTGLSSCKTAFFSPHLDARPIGTPHFMAPEMIRGCYADPRSDLYSLGVTLFVMMTGRTPFEKGAPLAVMSRHLTDVPQSLGEARPGLQVEFVRFVDSLMAKEPEHRFQSAKAALEVAEALYARLAEPIAVVAGTPLPNPAAISSCILQRPATAKKSWGVYAAEIIRHPAAISVISALATVGVLSLMMFLSHMVTGSRENLTPEPAVATQMQLVETEDFAKLLDQENDFTASPEAGAAAWANYLSRYPQAPAIRRSVARQRLEFYINEQNKRRPAPAPRKELEF